MTVRLPDSSIPSPLILWLWMMMSPRSYHSPSSSDPASRAVHAVHRVSSSALSAHVSTGHGIWSSMPLMVSW